MDFIEVIKKRRSIRKYKPNLVSKEKLDFVLEAARLAPSWANRQCWKYVIVTDESLKKKLSGSEFRWWTQAPVVIIGCADPDRSGNKHNQPYYMLDMGISMEHLMLAAADVGLGTCWIGGQFDEDIIKKVIGLPDEIRVVALTPLGYPDEEPPIKMRKTKEEIMNFNHW
jgi:nitroreductase